MVAFKVKLSPDVVIFTFIWSGLETFLRWLNMPGHVVYGEPVTAPSKTAVGVTLMP
jgi:hypothetical protein